MNDDSMKKGTELRLDAAIEGLQTSVPSGIAQIVIGTQSYSVADAIKLAQSRAEPWATRRVANEMLRRLSATRADDERAASRYLADLKAFLVVTLGRDNELLARFGFKPARPKRELTLEEKTASGAKAKATREAKRKKTP